MTKNGEDNKHISGKSLKLHLLNLYHCIFTLFCSYTYTVKNMPNQYLDRIKMNTEKNVCQCGMWVFASFFLVLLFIFSFHIHI